MHNSLKMSLSVSGNFKGAKSELLSHMQFSESIPLAPGHFQGAELQLSANDFRNVLLSGGVQPSDVFSWVCVI